MDGRRFDQFAKQLAARPSRRQLVRAVGGGLAGGVLALAGREQAGASVCRQGGATCLKNAQCCSGDCDLDTHRCTCVSGTLCRGRCVDSDTAPNDYTGCGQVCTSRNC